MTELSETDIEEIADAFKYKVEQVTSELDHSEELYALRSVNIYCRQVCIAWIEREISRDKNWRPDPEIDFLELHELIQTTAEQLLQKINTRKHNIFEKYPKYPNVYEPDLLDIKLPLAVCYDTKPIDLFFWARKMKLDVPYLMHRELACRINTLISKYLLQAFENQVDLRISFPYEFLGFKKNPEKKHALAKKLFNKARKPREYLSLNPFVIFNRVIGFSFLVLAAVSAYQEVWWATILFSLLYIRYRFNRHEGVLNAIQDEEYFGESIRRVVFLKSCIDNHKANYSQLRKALESIQESGISVDRNISLLVDELQSRPFDLWEEDRWYSEKLSGVLSSSMIEKINDALLAK